MFQGHNAAPSPEGGTGDEETARVAIDNPLPQGGSSRERRRSNQINKLSATGKFALVLFYDMNSCVQYKVSRTWLFYLTLVFACIDCPFISYVLTYVILLSFVIITVQCASSRPTWQIQTRPCHSLQEQVRFQRRRNLPR